MSLLVESPGMLTTIQDLGRPGSARLGVSAAGAADPVAARLANRLAGNRETAAVLEMTLLGGRFRLEAAVVVGLAGADMGAEVAGAPLPPWSAWCLPAGATLCFGPARDGARSYLAIGGGLDVEPVLGSRSTHLPSALGGLDGRSLRAGDRIPWGAGAPSPTPPGPGTDRPADPQRGGAIRPVARLDPGLVEGVAPRRHAAGADEARAVRVTRGGHADRFDAGALGAFLAETYRVSESSDRMGLRLEGPAIPQPRGGSMVSEGMPLGAVQIPPGGRPVVLFVDHQTTGGYPVLACVVSADHFRLGQLRPRDRVRFEEVDLETARRALLAQEAAIVSEDAVRPIPMGPP